MFDAMANSGLLHCHRPLQQKLTHHPPFLIPYPVASEYALDTSISGNLLGPHGVHGVPVVVQRAHAEVVLEYEVGLELLE